MKKEDISRVIIWAILAFISLGLGLTGFIYNDDSNKFLSWFNIKIDKKNNNIDIDFNYVVSELNEFLDNNYTDDASAVASYENNTIFITILADKEYNYEYTIKDNILSSEVNTEEEAFTSSTFFIKMVAIIQNKYFDVSEDDVMATFNSNDYSNFTLKDNGIESIKENNKYINRLDLNKKISIVDVTKEYIKVSDLNEHLSFLTGDGSLQLSKGNVLLYKSGYDNEAVISILEKNELTNNAYKSLISVINALFNEEEANYFTSEYPEINENTFFSGYTIEVNPEFNDMETYITNNKDYKLIRVTIDKSIINE